MTPTYPRLSASCQQITHENLSPNTSSPSITIRSCLGDPDLSPAILNHKCNNVVLTPSGLYFDMAVTVAKYLLKTPFFAGKNAPPEGINVRDMQVHKPLLVPNPSRISDCWIEMETTLLFPPSSTPPEAEIQTPTSEAHPLSLSCTFHSINPTGTTLQTMGRCTIHFESPTTWLSTWSHHTPVIQDRIDHLLTRAHKEMSGKVRLVQSQQAYKLFETFVQYGGEYRNMRECVFDEETGEATSLLDFFHHEGGGGEGGEDGKSEEGRVMMQREETRGPFVWDGSCHVSGFVCNAVEKEGVVQNAFISFGVGSMRISEKFRPWMGEGKGRGEVRNYVRMEALEGDGSVLRGDVYVLQGGEIVGVWEDVRFKRIPRRVLNVFLPPPKKESG